MSWHNYVEGQQVSLDEIVAKYEARIRSGEVENEEQKQEYLQQIRACGQAVLVYSPKGSGRGNSPLNPNNWRTLDGKPIGGDTIFPEDITPQ